MKFDAPRRAVFIAGFSAFIDLYAPQSVLHELAEQFRVDPATAGGIIGATTLAVALAAPFAGLIADRFGQRRTIIVAIFALVPVTACLALAGGLHEMVALRFLQGLLLPAIFSSAVALTSEFWPPAEAADVIGLYILGSVLGGFSGRFLTALAAEQFGWQGGFVLLAVVTLLAAVGLWRWLPSPPRRTAGTRVAALTGLFDHLRNPGILSTCAIGASVLFANVATFTYIDFRLARPPFLLSPAQLGSIFAVYLIGATGTPLSGRVIGMLGRRGALALAMGLGGLGMLATLADWLPLIVFGLALFASGVFMAQAASLSFLGQAARHAKSTAVGLYVCCYYLGGSLGAVLPGKLWDWGGWPACVGLVLVTTTSATGLAMWAWRGSGGGREPPRRRLSP